ncbi:MAG TPA: hypothetical protein VMA34_17975 [Terracidiphilus sp.]|nr:hypothetical protein [Terracidiphilus sp.]
MPSHSDHTSGNGAGHEPEDHKPEEVDTSLGYEGSDVGVTGIIVFMVSMAIFVVVTAASCYYIGKVINAQMNKEDGPTSKWSKTVDIRQLGNLPSNPEMQNKVAQLMQTFPTPRVQVDNGNEDIAVLHAKEDLLLDHYTWIDESKGTVRIPIERAMQLIAQQGLPVAPPVKTQLLMTGDARPEVTAPLTDGFAPTTFEQEQAAAQAAKVLQGEGK